MSDALNDSVYKRFASEVEQACKEGRGKELLDQFFQAQAERMARTVYLKMETVLAKAIDEDDDGGVDLAAWMQNFAESVGLELIANVSTTLSQAGGSDGQRADAEMLTARAYQAELDRLMDAAGARGRA